MTSIRWPIVGFVIFGCLSLADFLLTWRLLHQSSRFYESYESNPIAGEFLMKYGWTGLALFKTTVVVVFLTVTSIIIRYRRKTGALVLLFGCLAMLYVAVYSYRLQSVIDGKKPFELRSSGSTGQHIALLSR